MAKRRRKSEPVSAEMYSVEGRLFRSRAEALAYCKDQRISTYRIESVPPLAADLDPLKLSVRENWTLRVLFDDGADPVLLFEHAKAAHVFSVRMSDLVDLASTVKARVRELAKRSEL